MNNFWNNIKKILIIALIIMIIFSLPAYASRLRFLNVAKNCKEYLVENKYYYFQSHYDYPLDASKGHGIDCSGYVSWCIYEYQGGNFEGKTSKWFLKTARKIYNNKKTDSPEYTKGWRVISESQDFKPGDILCYSGHVEIYYGPGENDRQEVLNAGSDDALSEVVNSISQKKFERAQFAIRLP